MKPSGIKVSHIVAGLLLMTAGTLLYLFNTEILPPAYKWIVFSLPSLMFSIGFVCLFSRQKWGLGLLLMCMGGFMLLKNLHIPDLQFITQNGWTILLVVLGAIVLCKAVFGQRNARHYGNPEDRDVTDQRETGCRREKPSHCMRDGKERMEGAGYIDRNYVFGGAREKLDIRDFKGGEINCVFGGMELDLSGSQLAEGIHYLEVNTVFGGIALYVPAEWHIELRQNQMFGHFADSRPTPNSEINKNSTLILRVTSVFGGGEMKCKGK